MIFIQQLGAYSKIKRLHEIHEHNQNSWKIPDINDSNTNNKNSHKFYSVIIFNVQVYDSVRRPYSYDPVYSTNLSLFRKSSFGFFCRFFIIIKIYTRSSVIVVKQF